MPDDEKQPAEGSIEGDNVPELGEGDQEVNTIEDMAEKVKASEPGFGGEITTEEGKEGKVAEGKDKPKVDEAKPKPDSDEVSGLKAELKRVRATNKERSSEVQEVRERLAKMEGRLEAGAGGIEPSVESKLAKYSDEDLINLQMTHEDKRAEAKEAGDTDAMAKARANVTLLRVELHARQARAAKQASEDATDDAEMLDQASIVVKDALVAWPELKNEDSDISKACQVEFDKSPKMYKKLGIFADIVAIQAAVSKNPKLMGTGRDKAVRKEVVNELEKAAEGAVHSGGGGTSVKTSVNIDAMTGEDIEAAAERIKAGGSLAKP